MCARTVRGRRAGSGGLQLQRRAVLRNTSGARKREAGLRNGPAAGPACSWAPASIACVRLFRSELRLFTRCPACLPACLPACGSRSCRGEPGRCGSRGCRGGGGAAVEEAERRRCAGAGAAHHQVSLGGGGTCRRAALASGCWRLAWWDQRHGPVGASTRLCGSAHPLPCCSAVTFLVA